MKKGVIGNFKISKIIKDRVKKIVDGEVEYISGFFPYNIKYNSNLIYNQSILAFHNFNIQNSPLFSDIFLNKLTNLIGGIELLSIGTSFHNFDLDSFINTFKNKKDIEEEGGGEYTLKLLFGDILYSRAAIYLLKYGDHLFFDIILTSLKSVNNNKLLMFQKLMEVLKKDVDFIRKIDENKSLLIGINALLETTLKLGFDIFYTDKNKNDSKIISRIISEIVLLKTYQDLENFFKLLSNFISIETKINYITDKKIIVKDKLITTISKLKSNWIKDNFKSLIKIIQAFSFVNS